MVILSVIAFLAIGFRHVFKTRYSVSVGASITVDTNLGFGYGSSLLIFPVQLRHEGVVFVGLLVDVVHIFCVFLSVAVDAES